jgi:predicted O-methyltransferase YrrM
MSTVDTTPQAIFLPDLAPLSAVVGYGSLGTHGRLGYEGGHVTVEGTYFSRALSTHPPARVMYDLGGAYERFHCWVALNDDVPAGWSYADFIVRADGREVALMPDVRAGAGPIELIADVGGAQLLELSVRTTRWDFCHAVWLEPRLDHGDAPSPPEVITDCLARADIIVPRVKPRADRCVATVVSPGFAELLDDMLGSLRANGGCGDALVLVITLGVDASVADVVAKYGATLVRGTPRSALDQGCKSVLYSIARLVDAPRLICIDADVLILGSIDPVFSALDACPEGSILASREGNHHGFRNLADVLCGAYGGRSEDLAQIFGEPGDEWQYPLTVNDGVFAGSRAALLALDATIRAMPGAVAFVEERRDIAWRNQLIFNAALARLRCGVELDSSYNVQLHAQDVDLRVGDGVPLATWQGRPVRVLHRSGWGRRKYPELHGLYARVPDPLPPGGRDAYGAFVRTLRTWVGRHGLSALAWSFYGTPAGYARVRDADAFPLLALLHYIIRSNGCVQVLETGTARGVSAACLASAVAHRDGARVVAFDPNDYPERASLWNALEEPMRRCIDARLTGSCEGMTEAIAAGERFDAALLDSIHSAEHVWAEFDLARRLVCPGGLILIHDPGLEDGTVEGALDRIADAGYGITRMWAAEGGVAEDEGLQLAVIENRIGPQERRPHAAL